MHEFWHGLPTSLHGVPAKGVIRSIAPLRRQAAAQGVAAQAPAGGGTRSSRGRASCLRHARQPHRTTQRLRSCQRSIAPASRPPCMVPSQHALRCAAYAHSTEMRAGLLSSGRSCHVGRDPASGVAGSAATSRRMGQHAANGTGCAAAVTPAPETAPPQRRALSSRTASQRNHVLQRKKQYSKNSTLQLGPGEVQYRQVVEGCWSQPLLWDGAGPAAICSTLKRSLQLAARAEDVTAQKRPPACSRVACPGAGTSRAAGTRDTAKRKHRQAAWLRWPPHLGQTPHSSCCSTIERGGAGRGGVGSEAACRFAEG